MLGPNKPKAECKISKKSFRWYEAPVFWDLGGGVLIAYLFPVSESVVIVSTIPQVERFC